MEQALQEVTGEGAVLTDPKTFSSSRLVALPDYLASILANHLGRYTAEYPDPGVRLHDLRHLGGTITAQTGATLKEIMERLGHSTVAAAMRYQPVAENQAAEIASRLDVKLSNELGAVGGHERRLGSQWSGVGFHVSPGRTHIISLEGLSAEV